MLFSVAGIRRPLLRNSSHSESWPSSCLRRGSAFQQGRRQRPKQGGRDGVAELRDGGSASAGYGGQRVRLKILGFALKPVNAFGVIV